jgi:hypothetical protein
MLEGSVKPGGDDRYSVTLRKILLAKRMDVPADGVTLECQKTYVFKFAERLDSSFAKIGIFGQATAKSSVGRVDVLARLIVDGMDQYERFDARPLEGQSGDMYLEITPFTFRVKVKAGIRLSQLRLFYGEPKSVEVRGHQVDVSLRHGERMANLTLYRMSQDAKPEISDYGKQTLKLSGFFSEWPEKIEEVDKDGTVKAAV